MRVGYAPKDVVKKVADSVDIIESVASSGLAVDEKEEELKPTELEAAVLNTLKERLAFLVRSDLLFDEIVHVDFKKTVSSIRVFYKRPNKGVMLSFHIGKAGQAVFKFPLSNNLEIETDNFRDINGPLLDSFKKRLDESGIKEERQAPLRSVS